MIQLYHHRINSLAALDEVPATRGIEFDLRSDGDRILVTPDPFSSGPTAEEFFPRIGKRPCIFNVKCEGIESRVLELAKQNGIEEFFFLDLTVPAAVKLCRQGEKRLAVRYSEYEPAAAALAWAGRVRWVWVDCFTEYPMAEEDWTRIAYAFDICLVSPELQGHGTGAIERARATLAGRKFSAVCTKRPDLWERHE